MVTAAEKSQIEKEVIDIVRGLVDSYREGQNFYSEVPEDWSWEGYSLEDLAARYVDGERILNEETVSYSPEAVYLSARINQLTEIDEEEVRMELESDGVDEVLLGVYKDLWYFIQKGAVS